MGARPRLRTSTRSRPAQRTRDPEGKRARMMDAARRLFTQRGFAATTTADVARAARVSEGIVFHQFGSKAGLLEAVATEYGRGLARAMFEAAQRAERAGAAESMLRAAFDYVRERGALAQLLRFAPDPRDKGAAERATRSEIVSALARGLTQLSEAGRLRPLDPGIAAELLFALVEAALIECFVHGRGADEAAYLREAVACVEGALRRPTASAPAATGARE